MRKNILLVSVFLFVVTAHSVFGQVPAITGFGPSFGPVGTVVTINGTNFSAIAANNIVYFGAVKVIPSAATVTQLTVTVPSGAMYQPISVTVIGTGLTAYSGKPFIVTFSGPGGIDAGSFGRLDLTTSPNPSSIALGDMDGDGKIDANMVNNNSSNKVPIFRNTTTSPGSIGLNSFGPEVDLTSGPNPTVGAVGDLDGDGKLDLVVTNNNGTGTLAVSVFRNTNVSGSIVAGSFVAQTSLTTTASATTVAIADIDNDGKPDLIVGSNGSSVTVFRNISTAGTGIISFSAKSDIVTGLLSNVNVAAGDLDNDGKADLVITNFGTTTSSILVYRNIMTVPGAITAASFSKQASLTSNATPISPVIADLDQNGFSDLAVSNTDGSVGVFRNSTTLAGTVTFVAKVDLLTTAGANSTAMIAGDVDGDGKPDLAVSNNFNSNVSVFRNTNVSGSLAAASFLKTDFSCGSQPGGVAFGDWDGDGKLDLAVANFGSSSVSVFRNQISFVPTITSFSPQSGVAGSSVIISGFNFSATPANNTVYFGAAKATVTLATTTQLTVTVPFGATIQPITVTANAFTAYSTKIFTETFAGSGILDINSFSANVAFTTGAAPYRVLLSDLNGDGKSDMVSINRDGNSVSVFKNNTASPGAFTAASFTAIVDLVAGTKPYGGAIGDVDGDGKPDIVVSNSLDGTFSVFKNTSTVSTISFNAGVTFPTGVSPFGIAITDLDSDGKPDVVVVNKQDGTLSVFKNTISGSINVGSFASAFTLATGATPINLTAGDLNADGLPDLAVANYQDNTVSVFRNKSTPGTLNQNSFDLKVDYPTGNRPEGIILADLSGSGKLDIAASNQGENTVSVLKNNSSSAAAFAQNSFAAKFDFPNAIDPLSLAVGDLDGDGKLDLIDDGDNTTSYVKNISSQGSITQNSFALNVDFTATPYNIAVGDLDGDGKPEIVQAILGSNTIAVARNVTAVGFVKPTSRPTNLIFTTVTSTSFTASFTAAPTTPTGYIVFRKVGSPTTTAIPVDGTVYATNAVLGDGAVAYVGSGLSFNELGLIAGAQYFYTVFPYNGSGTSISYLTTTPLTGTQVLPSSGSLAAEPIAQPTDLVFSGVTSTSFTVSYTAAIGNPDGYLLVTSLNAPPTGFPQDGFAYTQGQTLTNGTGAIWDNGNSVTVGYNASAGQVVFMAIYSYKGSGAARNYYTILPLTGNVTTSTGVLATEPTFQPSFLFFSSITNTSYTVSYSAAPGPPAGYIALRKAGSAPTLAVPLDYTAYVVGANIGDAVVAYVGSASAFAETGLKPGTTYYYALYSYNGSATTINYFTTNPLTDHVQTGFPQPTIITFTPTHGFVGTPVTISGLNFSSVIGDDLVDFNESTAVVTSASANSITALVPFGAPSGQITLTLPGGLSSTSLLDFSVDTPPVPTITAVTPGSGFESATVVISGNYFFGSYQLPDVDFNGTVAVVDAATDTTITTSVPVGAVTGPINVTVLGQSVASTDFTVLHLTITAAVSPTTYLKDGSSSASITLNDLSSNPVVTFKSRGITAKETSAFQSRIITGSVKTFTAVFSSSELADAIGLEYYFKAASSQVGSEDDSVVSAVTTAYLKTVSSGAETTMPNLINGDQANDYQIISVPYVLDNPSVEAVFTSLGTYDATRWRFFSYANASNTTNPYIEYPTVANVNVGAGYWLIMRNAATINVGTGHTVNATRDSPFPIPLNSGHWTMIGNPYNFAVSWADIQAANPGLPSGTKFRTFSGGTFSDGNKMKKFGGGFVFTTSPWTLLIPTTLNVGVQAGRVGPTEKTYKSLDQPDWSVDLNLSNSEVSNNLGGIGMNPQAMLKGVDQFDEVSLPFPDGLGLSELVFRHPDLAVTLDKDIIPTTGSYTWEFEVNKGTDANVTLNWRNDYFGNGDNQLILFDPATVQIVDMRQKTSYAINAKTKKLQILFGPQHYIDIALDKELPLLGAVYPNPAQQRAVIPFRVPLSLEKANVNMTIYDDQGRAVLTVVNGEFQKGRYEAVWIPEGPAGLYYLQFRLGSNSPEYQKIIITR